MRKIFTAFFGFGIGIILLTFPSASKAATVWQNINIPGVSNNFNSPANNYGYNSVVVDPTSPNIVYIGTNYQGIYKSINSGVTWQKINTGTGSNMIDSGRTWSLAIDPFNPSTLYTTSGYGTGGPLKSTDGGISWTMIFNNNGTLEGTNNIVSTGTNDIYNVTVDPFIPNHILASFHSNWTLDQNLDSGIIESTNGGQSWIIHDPRKGWGPGNSIWFLNNSSTWLLGSQNAGYWRTTNSGANWTQVSTNNLDHGGVNDLYRDTNTGILYAGHFGGVMKSTDNGITWSNFNTGLPSAAFETLYSDGANLYTAPSFPDGGDNPQAHGPWYVVPLSGSTWSALSSQQTCDPSNNVCNGPVMMAFDPVNHFLYSVNWLGGAWKLSAGPVVTGTPGPSLTPAPTATPGPTSTPTPTPIPGSITFGETNILSGDDSGNGNLLVTQKATLSQSGTLQTLSFYVTVAAGRLQLGVYSDNAGNPGGLLANTAIFTPVTGWNTQPIVAPVVLNSGTYWLAYAPESNSLAFKHDQNSGSTAYYSSVFGSMPSTFATVHTNSTSHWSFYGSLISGPTPTPGIIIGTGDTNSDGVVNFSDISGLMTSWFTNQTIRGAGLDQYGDGFVNAFDFGVVYQKLLPTATPTPTPTPVQTSGTSIVGLHVLGNKIVNGQNQVVKLVGANRAGSEYMCLGGGANTFDGPSDLASIQALASWHMNIIRIPINEDCWLGINGEPNSMTAAAYQQAIVNYVNLLNQNGMAAIIDLQWAAPGTSVSNQLNPMPDADHAPAFWQSVANTFKTNSSTIFDLYNEPYPDNNSNSNAAWTCLLQGGTCPGVSYTAVGTQALVNTIRGAGANNIIMVPGLQYTNTLDQWLTHKPTDPQNNIAAAWHSYATQICNNASCWNSIIAPVMQQVPLIAGEIGENDCQDIYINPLMNWLDSSGGNYLAWAWNTYDCSSFPSLISDYSGTPTNFGVGFQQHLFGLAGIPTPTPKPIPMFSTTFPFGINVGSTQSITASDGTVYYPDTGGPAMTVDSTTYGFSPYTTGDSISGTSDPSLFSKGRTGTSGVWTINVPNGTYNVTLGAAQTSTYSFGQFGQDQNVQGQKVGTCVWSNNPGPAGCPLQVLPVPPIDQAQTVTYTVSVFNQQLQIQPAASFGGGRTTILDMIKVAKAGP